MAKDNNVILISDDETIEEFMSLKLVPLREMDSFLSIDYKKAYKSVGKPQVILIYCNSDKEQREECLKLIRHLRANEKLFATAIVLVMDNFDREFLLTAYSEDINDFMLRDAEKGSILLKLMWAFKQHTILKELRKRRDFLSDFGCVDKKTGVYKNKYKEDVFKHEYKYMDKKADNSVLLIGPSNAEGETYDYQNIVKVVQDFMRKTDIMIQGTGDKIYILLPNTPLVNVGNVYNKIKTNLKNPDSIVGTASIITEGNFKNLEKTLLANFDEALKQKTNVVQTEEKKTPDEDGEVKDETWNHYMKENLGTKKNFKIFKAAYEKKLNNVIAPTLFQLQKHYEEKIFETNVEYVSGETTSKFILTKGSAQSELQINYNGFSKINVNIVHQGSKDLENRNFEIDLSQITEENVTKLVEDFVKSFKSVND